MPIESIKNTVANPVLPGKSAKKDAVDQKGQAASAAVTASDTVSLTSMSHGLKRSAEVDSHDQQVNEARVAKIKAAIQDGSYVIDPERIAKKMLQFESNFPDTT